MRTVLTALALAVAFNSPAFAQRPLTLADTRHAAGVGSPTVSADGKSAAFIVSRPNYTVNRTESRLWSVNLAGGEPRLLTPSRGSVSSPQWAPVGRALAFLSPDSAGRNQLWVLPGEFGEARQVTSHPVAVEHFDWRPDGQALAYVAVDEEARREGEARFVTSFDVGSQDLFLRGNLRSQHLWLATLDSAPAKRLTQGKWTVQFSLPPGAGGAPTSWSPDGTRISFTQQVAPETGKGDSTRIAIVNLATGEISAMTGERTFERPSRVATSKPTDTARKREHDPHHRGPHAASASLRHGSKFDRDPAWAHAWCRTSCRTVAVRWTARQSRLRSPPGWRSRG